ncbi:MAG: CAP domain-containing protein [Actinomycetota bacterium]|nr:CAP domain-containing protein [Actinomycetota bacterium]
MTAALLALSVVAGGAAVAPSPVSAWSTEQVLEAQLLQQLNNERAARGVKPLVSDAGLEHASQVWSNHMSS